jgi:hypothetical protein
LWRLWVKRTPTLAYHFRVVGPRWWHPQEDSEEETGS